MILDQFRNLPEFPFGKYFEEPAHFRFAQHYWETLLIGSKGFDHNVWQTRQNNDQISQNMRTGRVVDWVSPSLGKAVMIHTSSLDGCIFDAIREAGPMDPSNLPKRLGAAKREAIIAGVMHENVRRDAIRYYQPTMVWVEPGFLWLPDRSIPDGGTEIPVERLIVTSEISETAERVVCEALDLFLTDGSAQDRVNPWVGPDRTGR